MPLSSILRGVLVCLSFAVATRAAEVSPADAVAAADDRRVAAFLSGDRARLDPVLSAELRYAHSNGNVDTKASLLDAVAARRLQYLELDGVERVISVLSADVATVSGHCHLKVSGNGQTIDMNVSFLAVYRREAESWRLIAWQSARLQPPPPKPVS